MRYPLLLISLSLLLLLPWGRSVQAQFAFDECSNTEAWLPVGEGLPSRAEFSTTLNGELYVLSTADDSNHVLSRWDGTSWSTVSEFATSDGPYGPRSVSDMKAYDGAIYIHGYFSSVNAIPGTSAFAKWDGTAWSAVPGHPLDNLRLDREYISSSERMTIYNGELVVAGSFKGVDNARHQGVLLWNGTRWLTIAEMAMADHSDSLYVTSFVEWRGDLYVGGSFIRIGGVDAAGIARWDGTSWSAVGDSRLPTVQQLFVFHDKLYMVRNFAPDEEFIVEWNGSSWHEIAGVVVPVFRGRIGVSNVLTSVAVAVFDDAVYLTATWWPPSRPGPVRTAVRWDGAVARPLARPNGDVEFLVVHDSTLIAGGDFTVSCGEPIANVAKLCIGSDCSGISGRVVASNLDDCDDARAPGLAGRILEFDPPAYAITDSDGLYRRYLSATGDYSIDLAPVRYTTQTCPIAPPSRIIRITTPGEPSSGNNFASQTIPNVRDLRVGIVNGIARRGMTLEYVVSCTNAGTMTVTGCTLAFRRDPRLVYQGSTLTPSRSWDDGLEWDIDSIRVGESRSIHVTYIVPIAKDYSSDLCASIYTDDHHDAWPADNGDSVCTPVIGSYDPNDIAVHPAGSGTDGTIQPHDSVLTYTVRFQNTGRDTAFRVVVFDTLDRNLDLASITLGPSSHPFRLRVEGTSLVWEFNDIKLPTIINDSTRSQGFFKYTVHLRKGLSPNTRIANRAGIYFDYNAGVITNTVITTTPSSLSSVESELMPHDPLGLYPNPTRGLIHLSDPIVRGSTIEVHDMLGRLVRSVRYEGSGDAAIDLDGLAAGVYMVSARTDAGDAVVRVTLTR